MKYNDGTWTVHGSSQAPPWPMASLRFAEISEVSITQTDQSVQRPRSSLLRTE